MKATKTTRGQERGTVIFVVLMVLTVLSAIGIFASRSAGLNQRTAGYSRQVTEAQYIADFGVNAMRYELTTSRKFSLQPGPTDLILSEVQAPGANGRPMHCKNLADNLRNVDFSAGATYFDNTIYDSLACDGAANAGYLDSAVPRPMFVVTISDVFEVGQIAGVDVNTKTTKPMQAVITATAWVSPVRPGAATTQEESRARTVRVSQAIVSYGL